MYIVKILKRRDAASVVVAIILAMAVSQALSQIGYDIGNRVTSLGNGESFGAPYGGGPGWEYTYLSPLVALLTQLVVIELGLRLAVLVRGMLVRRVK